VLQAVKEKVDSAAQELEKAKLQSAANTLISIGRIGNQYLNEKEPWKLFKTDMEKAATVLYVTAQIVKAATVVSAPFMPATAEQLWQTLNLPGSVHTSKWEEALKPLGVGHKIAKSKPLFQKIDADEKKLDDMLAADRKKLRSPPKNKLG
jgi:methionyl-tRNA synthetase